MVFFLQGQRWKAVLKNRFFCYKTHLPLSFLPPYSIIQKFFLSKQLDFFIPCYLTLKL